MALKLFTPGPVEMEPVVVQAGAAPMAYHRTAEFSETILGCERRLRRACGAGEEDRVLLLTASGTAAMEASALNLLDPSRPVLVVNGGDFGRRWLEICACHGIPAREIAVEPGRSVAASQLRPEEARGAAALLVNHHETSTGALHDLGLLGRFCREHGLLFIVDAVGSFLADPVAFAADGIDALIFSSQKALALPPGLSFVVLSGRAAAAAAAGSPRSYYFDFRRYLRDGARGQTPFTPAIGLIRQLDARLRQIERAGASALAARTRALALGFRALLPGLPYAPFAEHPSNAVTALRPLDGRSAAEHVRALAEAGFQVCPNGGPLADSVFRVGHLGALTAEDHRALASAMAGLFSLVPS